MHTIKSNVTDEVFEDGLHVITAKGLAIVVEMVRYYHDSTGEQQGLPEGYSFDHFSPLCHIVYDLYNITDTKLVPFN